MSSVTMFSLSQDSSWNQVSLCTVIILLFPRPRNFSCLVLSCLSPPSPTTIFKCYSLSSISPSLSWSSWLLISYFHKGFFFLSVFSVAEFCVRCSENMQVVMDCSLSSLQKHLTNIICHTWIPTYKEYGTTVSCQPRRYVPRYQSG